MADRDLEERSHAYWRALAAQPQHRAATESLADGYPRQHWQTNNRVRLAGFR